ncbi:TonB-dependent receptor domain-containing protein [Hyphococcus sp.]|uniref:TonB-dependent receptor domain-containing protein n=1 Tax=Hyphococcus sp. TaxID=2038636 RepID=UPI003CCBD277
MHKKIRSRAMMGAAAVAIAPAAFLATAAPAAAQDDAADDVVIVTGTRLMTNPNLSSAQPVLSVTDEEVDIRGAVRIEDFINVLPQLSAGQTTEVSNGASGTAQLDLRGIGPIRTLVLIDGRRLPYGDSATSAPNVDLIPTQLVERVDILTGGASAVYGSDAVAGVANFILKRDFEGIELDVLGGINQAGNGIEFLDNIALAGGQPVAPGSWDGESLNLALTMGANTSDGRGNVTLFTSYETVEAITQDNRSVSACAMGTGTGAGTFSGFGCVGSGNFRLFGGTGGDAFQQEDGTITTYQGGPAETYNFGPLNYFQRPSERFQVYARGHYELADNLEAFADFGYVQNNSDAQIAPSATFGGWSINCDNPLLQTPGLNLATDIYECSAADIANGTIIGDLMDEMGNFDGDDAPVTASHRNVEGGPRNSELDNDALRIVTGLRGDLGGWAWEAFFQYSKTSDVDISTNDFLIDQAQNALLVESDGMGGVQCISAAARANGCVPYNIWQRGPNGESLVSQAALNYIQGVGITTGETQQIVTGGNIQTDLGEYGWTMPWTDAGVGFLAGIEWRKDSLNAQPDQISQRADGGFTGVGGPTLPVAGSLEALELYTELQVPLITERPLFEELTFSGQYRFSDYKAAGNNTTNSFNTHAFGLMLNWVPVEDIRLRGQFQRAVRAPNVIELYTGIATGLPDLDPAGTNTNGIQLFDPCSSDAPIRSLADCMNTGVTSGQYGSISDVLAGQTQSITGGNTALSPETSDTWTGGVLFTPSTVPGLSVSIDYFNISVDDYISPGIAAQTILNNCLDSGDPTFCDLIMRGPGGTLRAGIVTTSGFDARNLNIASLKTSGVDFQARYSMDLADVGVGEMGSLGFDYASTYLISKDFTPFPGGNPIECAGNVGNDCKGTTVAVNPTYSHRLLTTWRTPANIDLSVTWRYMTSVDNTAASAVEPGFASYSYIDLAANMQVTESVNLRAGVNNVLDSDPPLFTAAGTGTGNGNTFPGTYDIGRFLFLGANFRF